MSITGPRLSGALATLADCDRLWNTLTTEYIPGLTVELHFKRDQQGSPYVLMELADYSSLPETSMIMRSVWSRREFHSPLYLISHTQLFDLLIVGFRVIDEYFTTGRDNRPPPL